MLPSPRASAGLLCVAAALALAGTHAPAAVAAGFGEAGALNGLVEGQSETTTSTPTTTNVKSSEPTNSDTLILLVLGAAVLLLMGIAFVIVRDARNVAPASDGELLEARSAHRSAAVLRRRRARAKAARRQRKRNR
jgi:hypothetical protein